MGRNEVKKGEKGRKEGEINMKVGERR